MNDDIMNSGNHARIAKTPRAKAGPMAEEVCSHVNYMLGATAPTEAREQMHLQFKMEGVSYDEITGMFSIVMDRKIIDEQDWQVIAGSFGLQHVPEHLRDDLVNMVMKHQLMEALTERVIVGG